jgi:hypothetical protein
MKFKFNETKAERPQFFIYFMLKILEIIKLKDRFIKDIQSLYFLLSLNKN